MQNEVFKKTSPVVLSELILLLVFTDDNRLNRCYCVLSLSYFLSKSKTLLSGISDLLLRYEIKVDTEAVIRLNPNYFILDSGI